ncbi:quinolinate synthase NadA [bacterium]|nr:quinolinate synthase NadA [bacterium]
MFEEIKKLKKEKNALIIAHYYQDGEIQDLADYVGDSYGMALYANKQKNPIVVVCGVKFMAETIKVYNMEKKVLLPDVNAGCSLADSCTPPVFEHFKQKHPGSFVMTYVNSSLEVKALSDVICTSANAVKIASKVPQNQKILFGPDQHLGRHVAKKLGRDMVMFPGSCFVHMSFNVKEILRLKLEHPLAKIVAHPECEEQLLNMADFIGSTSQLLEFTQKDEAKTFIVLTEAGIEHQMKKLSPQKTFIMGPDLDGCACNNCPHMKLNTLEKLYDCLKNESPEIHIEPSLAARALIPLNRMIEMAA